LAGLAAQVVASDAKTGNGAKLGDAVQSIRATADNAEADLLTVNEESMLVMQAIESLSGYSDFHADLCALLEEACEELSQLAGDRVAETERDPVVDAMLDKIFKSYSMSRERDIHRDIVGAGEAHEAEQKSTDSDDELFASALF